jgi:hypothetical protein
MESFGISNQALIQIGKDCALNWRTMDWRRFWDRGMLPVQELDFGKVSIGVGLPGVMLADALDAILGEGLPLLLVA